MVGQSDWGVLHYNLLLQKPIWAQQLSFGGHRPALIGVLGKVAPLLGADANTSTLERAVAL